MPTLLKTAILITFGMLIIGIISGCSDNSPEEVTDSSQSEGDVPPPPVTVLVDPALTRPHAAIVTNTEFTLTFSEEVMKVTVNDTPASGSGLYWKWSMFPGLPYGSLKLEIEWKNRDGSKGFRIVGPYTVKDGNGEPPVITGGTVVDGSSDVDPIAVTVSGIEVHFDEDVTGTIKLTDEAGKDLNWIANVGGSTARLTPVAGQELVNETTYKIEINVQDGAGNPLKATITFVTQPK